MEYDHNKIDDMVLALLWLTRAGNGRAWKSHDWDALERLHAKAYISNPRSKAKSLVFSEEGEHQARELVERHFGRKDWSEANLRTVRKRSARTFRMADQPLRT